MAQYEKVPVYVAAMPQEVAAARKQLTKLKANSAFALMQGARRGSLQAKLHSVMKLSAPEYAEFGDIVPADFSISRTRRQQTARWSRSSGLSTATTRFRS